MPAIRPPITPGLKLAIDFGPLAVFFAANMLTHGDAIYRILVATSCFMAATAAAMAVSYWKTGHVAPMLWITGALVLIFGGLTIIFKDGTFIKMKPTVVYLMFSAALTFGLLTGRPLLQSLLETAYPGLSTAGWRRLTINWIWFFIGMAVLNEAVWRFTAPNPDSDIAFWAGFKVWGAVPLTLLFAFANIPMMMRHGLNIDNKTDIDIPPEG